MPLKPLFDCLQPLIDECFAGAITDGGPPASAIDLQIAEEPLRKGRLRAEFMVLDPAGPVRITWNGVASLWAFCQGASRLTRRIFDGKRQGKQGLFVDEDTEVRRGLDSLVLATRFCSQDIPAHAATVSLWPEWAPPIDAKAAPNSDNHIGNWYFTGALGWIFRHEIAHITLQHACRQRAEQLTDQCCEREADLQATRWFRGQREADANRKTGVIPSSDELELESRAIFVGLGLVWVALFEAERSSPSEKHPPAAERLFACLKEMNLREDSFAAEVIADLVHVWVAPEERWGPTEGYPTAHDAIDETMFQLHRHLAR